MIRPFLWVLLYVITFLLCLPLSAILLVVGSILILTVLVLISALLLFILALLLACLIPALLFVGLCAPFTLPYALLTKRNPWKKGE